MCKPIVHNVHNAQFIQWWMGIQYYAQWGLLPAVDSPQCPQNFKGEGVGPSDRAEQKRRVHEQFFLLQPTVKDYLTTKQFFYF